LTRSSNPNRQRWIDLVASVGRWILLLAFGFFLAGSIVSYLAALNERLLFIIDWIRAIASM
jgi:hypothetical protein